MEESVRVEFSTVDGVTLRGVFYPADGDGVGAVVMSGGFTLPKESVAGMAAGFQEAGISALVYDHRNFGSSDGTPRQHSDPYQHAEDYHDAVTAAGTMPGVDPARIAIWGIGHSAGWVMMAAADDPRLKAAVIYRPIHSGSVNAKGFPEGTLWRAWAERVARAQAADTEPVYIKAWPDSLENARGAGEQALVGGEAAFHLRTAVLAAAEAAGTPWPNRITQQSAYHVARVEAQDHLHRIGVPTLYVVGGGDPFGLPVDVNRSHFERLGGNGEFYVSEPPSGDNFQERFPEEIAEQIKFLHRVL